MYKNIYFKPGPIVYPKKLVVKLFDLQENGDKSRAWGRILPGERYRNI
jgi:hypothetical protein